MTSLSPGPWRWVRFSDEDGSGNESDNSRLVAADGSEVCWFGSTEMFYPTAGNEPSFADEAVIAASWGLLRALRLLGSGTSDKDLCFCEMRIDRPGVTSHSEACLAARSAIARATAPAGS